MAPSRSTHARSTRISAGAILAPVVLGVAVIALVQLAVVGLDIKPFVLPSPVDVATQFGDTLDTIWAATVVTGRNALIGLVAGALLAVIAAVIASGIRVVDDLTAPVVVTVGVIPIVALAPILYTMFGADAETTRQIIASLAVFIPVYVNSLRGFRQVLPVHRELMRVTAATRWQSARVVVLPSAVPYIFTGLRVASSLAVISALIAEYFGGPVGGLGKSITSAAASSNYALAWAYVIGSILLGLVFYGVTLALEKFVSRHHPVST